MNIQPRVLRESRDNILNIFLHLCGERGSAWKIEKETSAETRRERKFSTRRDASNSTKKPAPGKVLLPKDFPRFPLPAISLYVAQRLHQESTIWLSTRRNNRSFSIRWNDEENRRKRGLLLLPLYVKFLSSPLLPSSLVSFSFFCCLAKSDRTDRC